MKLQIKSIKSIQTINKIDSDFQVINNGLNDCLFTTIISVIRVGIGIINNTIHTLLELVDIGIVPGPLVVDVGHVGFDLLVDLDIDPVEPSVVIIHTSE